MLGGGGGGGIFAEEANLGGGGILMWWWWWHQCESSAGTVLQWTESGSAPLVLICKCGMCSWEINDALSSLQR